MLAIHVNSSAPFFAKRGAESAYHIEPYDLYCTALSALQWQKQNGRIILVTDKTCADYYKKIGLAALWDGIRIFIPDDLEGIDPVMFWAAGKLLALREMISPVVMLDTDFIVWEKISFGEEIICAHREELSPAVYPDPDGFQLCGGYILDPQLDRTAEPCNTAFLYLPDEDFKQFYVSQAIGFMKHSALYDDPLCRMVFAEQRLLAMCAAKLGKNVQTLLDKERLFARQQEFTHLWGAKQVLRRDKAELMHFCRRCRERIERDFPQYSYICALIENTS